MIIKKLKKWLVVCAAAIAAHGVWGNECDYEWSYGDGGVVINRYVGGATYVEIPSEIQGMPVVGIGDRAFYGMTQIHDVMIPDSVTSIGDYAFYGCSSFICSTLPDSVTSIGDYTFYGCSSFICSTLPDSVTSIGDYAFAHCTSLSNMKISGNVRNIGKCTFGWCRSLKSVVISHGVTKIGENMFSFCDSLEVVEMPNSIVSIGAGAFWECHSLVNVAIPDGVISIEGGAFRYCSSLTSVTIPDSVRSIASVAFGCDSSRFQTIVVGENNAFYKSVDGIVLSKDGQRLIACPSGKTNVSISNSVTSIGPGAFAGCLIKKMVIPDGVLSIGDSAFAGCRLLESIIIPNSVINIGHQAFYGCDKLYDTTSISDIKLVDGWVVGHSGYSSSIPNNLDLLGIRGIADYTFRNCSSIKSVTISGDDVKIGSAFSSCGSLTSVTIGDGVTSIGDDAFEYCSSLMSVTIPNSVTNIGDWAFNGCSSLTSVTIPDSVTSIGGSAFSGCSSLTSIIIPDSVTNIGDWAFRNCSSLTSVTIGDSVTSIGNYAFYGCSSLTSIIIPDSVTSIGDDAFSGCSSLTSIIIPDSVTNIGDDAFSGCSSLTSITIPDSVTSVGHDMFSGCGSLTRVTIPDSVIREGVNYALGVSVREVIIKEGVTSIGSYAFRNCSSLTSVTIPDSVTSIGSYAFYDCRSLTSVTIPDSVTSIGSYAFRNCSSLTSVTIGDSVTSIGSSAFRACSSLASVTIPDSVTSIGDDAFSGCSSLTSIIIPDSVTNIGDWAFNGCSSLTSVTIGDSVTSIGNKAFSGCSSLASVTIGDSVMSIGGSAFRYCSSLTSVTFMGDVPDGIENSYILSYATKVYYPEKYAAAYEAIVPASQFGGYVNEDGTVGIVSEINYAGLQGATHTNVATYVEGVGIAAFAEPTDINGYTFIGWSPAQIPADATGVQTITAQWRKDELSVPVISAPSVFETPSCTVTISTEDGAAIYYTLDGSAPSALSPRYTGPIVLTRTATVRAIAVCEDYFDSPVAECTVTQKLKSFGECLNCEKLSFTTGGDAEWCRAYGESDDGFALRSGDITHSQTSRLDVVVSGSGMITFSCRVEGEIYRNVVFDGLAFFIDGVQQGGLIGDTSWTRKVFSVKGAGNHTLSWRYVKDYEGDGTGADCAWLDCVVWESVAEVIPEVKDDSEVEAVLKESADTKLVENIKDAAEYNAYREWAAKLPDVTPQQVKESPQAWLSYALDADTLIAEAPKSEDVKIDEFKAETSTPGEFNLSVSVENVTIGENAKTENLAKVFGIEGATSLDGNGFSSENVGIEFGKPVDGKVKLKATPKDKSVKSFFMRVKVK